jgi:hypothetical protein
MARAVMTPTLLLVLLGALTVPGSRLPPRAPEVTGGSAEEDATPRRRLVVQVSASCQLGSTRAQAETHPGVVTSDGDLLPPGTSWELDGWPDPLVNEAPGREGRGRYEDVWTTSCTEAEPGGVLSRPVSVRGGAVRVYPPPQQRGSRLGAQPVSQ